MTDVKQMSKYIQVYIYIILCVCMFVYVVCYSVYFLYVASSFFCSQKEKGNSCYINFYISVGSHRLLLGQ